AQAEQTMEVRKEIVALWTRARVLSPYTSLLVLEQDWHYRRFGVDRRGDILTVHEGALDVIERPSEPADARGSMWGDTIGDSFGAGGLGLSGIGSGAGGEPAVPPPVATFGSGHGRLGT